MTYARSLVYSFVNRMAQFAMRNPSGLDYRNYEAVPGGCYEDLELHGLLNQVEDDRAHAEAVKLRGWGQKYKDVSEEVQNEGKKALSLFIGQALMNAAHDMDPYEERDGQLVRKSDGKPVIL